MPSNTKFTSGRYTSPAKNVDDAELAKALKEKIGKEYHEAMGLVSPD